ncbi:MAG: glycoside hydrolase family protein [Candidatus Cryptobacteroides sp.]
MNNTFLQAIALLVVTVLSAVSCGKMEYAAGRVEIGIVESGDSKFARGFSAFALDDHFVWCGSAIKCREDGRYYLFFSAMESGQGCPVFNQAWLFGSKIGVAVSDSPYGGYKFLKFVCNTDGYRPDFSSWDSQTVSNTHIKYFEGRYYLYYCGSSEPDSSAVVRGNLGRRDMIQQNQKIGVLSFATVADFLEGNYESSGEPLIVPRTRVKKDNILNPSPDGTVPLPDNIIAVNPAVEYNPVTGKYLLYFKGNIYDPSWRGVHGVAVSDRPDGPFEVQDDFMFEFEGGDAKLNAEDPFVWYHHKDKCFYAVFKDFTGGFTQAGPGLAIMKSVDGMKWKLHKHPLFMKKEITLMDGRVIEVDRLERPQLLLDEDDNPVVLYAACAITPVDKKNDGSSFNIQIPVKAPGK